MTEEEALSPMHMYSPDSLELEEEEAPPIVVEEVLPSTKENLSPSLIMLGTLWLAAKRVKRFLWGGLACKLKEYKYNMTA